jgi:uncharacterized membrane protein
MTFSDGKDWATVLFDFESGQVALTGSRKTGRLNRMASDDLSQFFAEQLGDAVTDEATRAALPPTEEAPAKDEAPAGADNAAPPSPSETPGEAPAEAKSP